MHRERFNLKTEDGLSLYGRLWKPGHDPTGVVCIVHGLGEHSGRYEHFSECLTGQGYAVTTVDMRGHGRSEGRRGHISSYEALMRDISLMLAETAGRFPDRPIFLFGQSMGGNLVINYALRREPGIAAVIASSPMLRAAFRPPYWKTFTGKYLRPVLPLLSLYNEIRAEDLSRDPDVVHAYKNDPLVHDRLTLRFYEVLLAGERAIRHAAKLTVPTLIMHGDRDRVTSLEASREFSAGAGDICTLKVWEGFYHEIHNEPDKERAFAYLIEWLKIRISVQ